MIEDFGSTIGSKRIAFLSAPRVPLAFAVPYQKMYGQQQYGQGPLPPPPGQNSVPPPPSGDTKPRWENAPPYVYRKMQEQQRELADLKEGKRAQDEVELTKIRNQELTTAVGLAVEGTLAKGLGTIAKKLGGTNRTTFTGGLNRSLRKRDSAESAEEADTDPKGGSMWDAFAGLMAAQLPKKNRKNEGAGSSEDHRKKERSPSRRQSRRDHGRNRDSRSPSHRRQRSPSRRRRDSDRRRRSASRSRPHGRSRSPPRRNAKRSPTPRRNAKRSPTPKGSLTPKRKSNTPPRRNAGRGGAPKKNRQLTPYKQEEEKKAGAANAEAVTQLLMLCGGANPIDDAQFPKWDTDIDGFLKELSKAPTVSKEKLDGLLEKNGLKKAFTNEKVGKLQQLLNFICNVD